MTSRGRKRPYDVAISFAGEDRRLAESLATVLKHNGIKVFYDEFEQSKLWGRDLYQYLNRTYKDSAKYCVVLVSRHYLKKKWTRLELQSAQARSFMQRKEYILPIEVDATELPGINPTTGYIEASQRDIRDIVDLISEKLQRKPLLISDAMRKNWDGQFEMYNGARVVSYWPELIRRAQKSRSLTFTTELDRIPYGKEKRYGRGNLAKNCHDCGVTKGQLHVLNCDMEECPSCGEQLLACDCTTTDDYVRVPRLG